MQLSGPYLNEKNEVQTTKKRTLRFLDEFNQCTQISLEEKAQAKKISRYFEKLFGPRINFGPKNQFWNLAQILAYLGSPIRLLLTKKSHFWKDAQTSAFDKKRTDLLKYAENLNFMLIWERELKIASDNSVSY